MNATAGYVGITTIHNDSYIPGNGSMGILIIPKPMNTAINFFIMTILFITMISLGCTMEVSKIRAHLLKPKGVAIALLAQFCIMPLTAFSLTKILQLDPIKAVTVLICGCSPGGSLSNILSFLLKGDMNLRDKCFRTISMETGCQNVQLLTAILKVAFSPQAIGPLFLFPMLYSTFQFAEALLLVLCFRCYQTVMASHGGKYWNSLSAFVERG
ncbi:hypothetical protein XENOCAPTIV_027026 [Xenoophorus captivus]|uniref:Solute carrier family 10 member 1 n=1 Tax=Xenoophorus captivus TaxID=1517983 RepID=A0ABV0SDH0_9TELE